jgi:hypothetical protein
MTTATDQIEGQVESVNERGIKVAGEWRNQSKFHPVDLPERGARGRLDLDPRASSKACRSSTPRRPRVRRIAPWKSAVWLA